MTADDGVNMPEDMQLDSTILKLAEQRASIDKKRKDLNEDAREINSNVDKLGINPSAFMLAVRLVKGMDKRDRDEFLSSTRRVTRVIGERQFELYPEESERLRKKAEDKKAREAEAKTKAGRDPDHPRSDPKSGGAGKKKGKKSAVAGERPTEEELTKAAAEAIQQQSDPGDPEQIEGAAVLDALAPETRSQSEEAEERRKAAGLN